MSQPEPDLGAHDSELGRLEEQVLELLRDEGPMQVSDVAEELDCTHEEARSSMSDLSQKHLVASLPNFEYEYVGEQPEKRPA